MGDFEAPRRDEVLATIREIFRRELEREAPVNLGDQLLRDLELDSMGLTVLAVGLEDRFRVKLSEDDSAQVVTVSDLVERVLTHLSRPASAA